MIRLFLIGLLTLTPAGGHADTDDQAISKPTPSLPFFAEAMIKTEPTAALDASEPAPKTGKGKARFLELHQSFLDRAKAGPVGLLFLGDSIIYQWAKQAPELWERAYGKYQPANFGIGADMTQHVVWRIENGELDHVDPRVVVLLIGTNNTATHTAGQILAANTKIVRLIREKLPQSKVLLLGILPRGPRSPGKDGIPRDDGVSRMAVINEVNDGLAKIDDGKNVRFLNINSVLLGPDGNVPSDIMPDQLHPNQKGYELWAKAMQPLLSEMMEIPSPK